jgi:RHS repeat-associated protein
MGMVNELTRTGTWFDYDTMGNLVGSTHNETEKLFRVPDAVGNLYRKPDRSDRKYGAGGRLLETENAKYHYDKDGNIAAKVVDNNKTWLYKWNANGSLREVERPDHRTVAFEYDALGRRTAKTYNGHVTRWVWDGNTPLHEWTYDEKDRPKIVLDEYGLSHKEGDEPTENITTWVFEEGSFRPAAKLTKDKKYSIITDYLGTPAQMYDEQGQLVWETRLDIYGKVHTFAGRSLSDCPFRYAGQYEDAETGLYYNRFRYYSPEEGIYLSQDPIGLAGNNPTLYGYVKDVNSWMDVFGLDCKVKIKDGDGLTHDIVAEINKKDFGDAGKHLDDIANDHIYIINRKGTVSNRQQAMKGFPSKSGFDRDEVPMAMFKEGGAGASVRYINPSDNRAAGSAIGAALRDYPDGTRVLFKII